MAFLFASFRFPNRPRPRRRSRPRPLVSGLVIEKAVIDRTNRIDTTRVQRGRGRERRRGRGRLGKLRKQAGEPSSKNLLFTYSFKEWTSSRTDNKKPKSRSLPLVGVRADALLAPFLIVLVLGLW